ncbi:hypothetical protein ZIOFF_016433 [Zingiber officinale]|uniref:Uncharacterized protein n=1 Tax=Zingiber officinale TaxID=94328 RepID=A0A8J5HFK5_ZINOF|nr:hypothetical protein ZIOFF_016433 [Zingiber officinale]
MVSKIDTPTSRLQQSDETPMVWEMLLYLYVIYSPDWHYRSTMPTFLFVYGAAFAVVHFFVRFGIGFKIHYIVLCLLCVPRMYKFYIQTKDIAAKRLVKLYVMIPKSRIERENIHKLFDTGFSLHSETDVRHILLVLEKHELELALYHITNSAIHADKVEHEPFSFFLFSLYHVYVL